MFEKKSIKYWICCITFILSLFLCTTSIFARAGGGSGGGGGSSSSHGGHYSNSNRSNGDYIGGWILFIAFSGSIALLKNYDIIKLSRKTKEKLSNSAKKDPVWKKESITKRIREIYFAVQENWSMQNIEGLKPYVSASLLSQWEAKIEWMKYRYEQNVLENIHLIDKKVIYLHDDCDDSKDYFFAYIQGKMKDSTIDTLSKLTIEKHTSIFVEYWRFLRIDNTFYLDAIFQEDEININEFNEEE